MDKRKVIKLPSGNYVYTDSIAGYSIEDGDTLDTLYYVECVGCKVFAGKHMQKTGIGGEESNLPYYLHSLDDLIQFVKEAARTNLNKEVNNG